MMVRNTMSTLKSNLNTEVNSPPNTNVTRVRNTPSSFLQAACISESTTVLMISAHEFSNSETVAGAFTISLPCFLYILTIDVISMHSTRIAPSAMIVSTKIATRSMRPSSTSPLLPNTNLINVPVNPVCGSLPPVKSALKIAWTISVHAASTLFVASTAAFRSMCLTTKTNRSNIIARAMRHSTPIVTAPIATEPATITGATKPARAITAPMATITNIMRPRSTISSNICPLTTMATSASTRNTKDSVNITSAMITMFSKNSLLASSVNSDNKAKSFITPHIINTTDTRAMSPITKGNASIGTTIARRLTASITRITARTASATVYIESSNESSVSRIDMDTFSTSACNLASPIAERILIMPLIANNIT